VKFSLSGFDPTLALWVWVAVVLTGLVAWLLTRHASADKPTVGQTMMEMVFEFIGGLAQGAMGDDPAFLNFLVMLFLFLLVANFQGMLPAFQSPTANLNVTAALAILTFALMWVFGFRKKGLGYFRHWIHPGGPIGLGMLPINIIEDFSKPLTLAFRLFGNILVGAIFMGIIAVGVAYFKGGFVLGLVWWAFTAFVNVVQAFIFMILTLSYVGQAQAADH
jgi:F-type H+-transporting ATPase subunit a